MVFYNPNPRDKESVPTSFYETLSAAERDIRPFALGVQDTVITVGGIAEYADPFGLVPGSAAVAKAARVLRSLKRVGVYVSPKNRFNPTRKGASHAPSKKRRSKASAPGAVAVRVQHPAVRGKRTTQTKKLSVRTGSFKRPKRRRSSRGAGGKRKKKPKRSRIKRRAKRSQF